MSEQMTGATPEQIEAAAKRWAPDTYLGDCELSMKHCRGAINAVARYLVPVGYVIVPDATVSTPEEPAAVGDEDDDEWKPRDRTSALMLEASEIGSVDLKFDRGSAPFTVYIHANRYETFQGHGYSLEEATEAALADARTPR